MPIRTQTFEKSSLLDRTLYLNGKAPNMECDDTGLYFNPDSTGWGKVIAEASHTWQPVESNDMIWDSVKLDLIRHADVTPADFELIISLLGITDKGKIAIIGEQVINTCPITETKETVYFDLINSACKPLFYGSIGTAASNKIQLNLPKRYNYLNEGVQVNNYESIQLIKYWLTGWNKCKIAALNGSTTANTTNYVIRNVIIAYDSDMNTDFSDIRFAIWNGYKLVSLDHNKLYYTPSTSAKFDIFLPYIYQNSTQSIYMFYGNSSATDASVTTFYELYDALDSLTGWTKVRGADWTDGGDYVYNTSAGATNVMKKTYAASGDKSYRFRIRANNTGDAPWAGLMINSPNTDYNNFDQGYLILCYTNGSSIYNKVKIFEVAGGTPVEVASANYTFTTGTWYDIEVQFRDEAGFNVLINGVVVLWYLDTTYTTGAVIRLFNTSTSGVRHDFDQLMVTNWMNNEPTLGSFGSEESPATINPDNISMGVTSINFSFPLNTSDNIPYYLKLKEYDELEFISRPILLSNRGIAQLGYKNLDSFIALRLYLRSNCDSSHHYCISKIEYVYEI